jgi:diguanylate cyclase (GGDEF)-like protein/PAS domain S-box-containing protein
MLAAQVADAVSDALVVADPNGRVRWANAAATRLFGQTLDAVRGRSLTALLPGAHGDPEAAARLAQALAHSTPLDLDLMEGAVTGVGRVFEVGVRPLVDAGGAAYAMLVVVRDVSGARRAVERVERLGRMNAVRARVGRAIADSADDGALFEAVCLSAVEEGGLRLAWIGRPDPPEAPFAFLASAGATAYLRGILTSDRPEVVGGHGPARAAWLSGRPVVLQDFARSPLAAAWADAARRHGLGASAFLPIVRGGRVDSVLAVYYGERDVLDVEMTGVIEEMARDLGRALERFDLVRAQAQAARSLRLAASVFANVGEAIAICDGDGRVMDVNPAFERLTGYGAAMAIGREFVDLLGGANPGALADGWRRAWREGAWSGEVRCTRRGGDAFLAGLSASVVADTEGAGGARAGHLVAAFWDLTDAKAQEAALRRLAYHDALTGVPNRLALERHLPGAIARARRHGTRLAVAMLDLDEFKAVNDRHGHDAGDEVLRVIARRMTAALRDTDLVARLGGDEFVLVLEGLADEGDVATALERVRRAIEAPVGGAWGRELGTVGASLGYTLYPGDADEGDTLLRHADIALYRAKETKGRRGAWYARYRDAASGGPVSDHGGA